MQTKNQKINAGVYLLFCLCTSSGYIGQSAELTKRLKYQFWLLGANRHKHKELQQDWNDYGPHCFIVELLEAVADKALLCARERAWTKKCLVEGKVYNRLNAVTAKHREDFEKHKPKWPTEPPANGAQEYIFVSPAGDVMKVKGLRGICEAYDLSPSHLSKVDRGIYVQHKGWTSGRIPD